MPQPLAHVFRAMRSVLPVAVLAVSVALPGTIAAQATRATSSIAAARPLNAYPVTRPATAISWATGRGVTVYVFDSGVDSAHPAFSGRVRAGFDATGGAPANTLHGTAVAGIIAASTTGIAPDADVVSVRISAGGEAGGVSLDAMLGAIKWVLADHAAHPGPAVINWSFVFGGEGVPEPELTRAVQRLHDAGMAVIVAAGNDGFDECLTGSTILPDVFPVGAARVDTVKPLWRPAREVVTREDYSTHGRCVQMFAPGDSVRTLAPEGSSNPVARVTGTSFAAPQVTGAAALYLERHPEATPDEVFAYLRADATQGTVRDAAPAASRMLRF